MMEKLKRFIFKSRLLVRMQNKYLRKEREEDGIEKAKHAIFGKFREFGEVNLQDKFITNNI